MVKAIIYTSQTGFTRKYARLLAQETGLMAYELGKAPGKIQSDDPVIYMGWLKAGRLMGLDSALKQHRSPRSVLWVWALNVRAAPRPRGYSGCTVWTLCPFFICRVDTMIQS